LPLPSPPPSFQLLCPPAVMSDNPIRLAFHRAFYEQLEAIATEGIMPSKGVSLSKLLCACYSVKSAGSDTETQEYQYTSKPQESTTRNEEKRAEKREEKKEEDEESGVLIEEI
ncbi:hypothetical protein PFISCL1PPCAC_20832, partial [Pristionchus fissidentatus]